MTTIQKEKDVFVFASRIYNFHYIPLLEYISLNPFHVMMFLENGVRLRASLIIFKNLLCCWGIFSITYDIIATVWHNSENKIVNFEPKYN